MRPQGGEAQHNPRGIPVSVISVRRCDWARSGSGDSALNDGGEALPVCSRRLLARFLRDLGTGPLFSEGWLFFCFHCCYCCCTSSRVSPLFLSHTPYPPRHPPFFPFLECARGFRAFASYFTQTLAARRCLEFFFPGEARRFIVRREDVIVRRLEKKRHFQVNRLLLLLPPGISQTCRGAR